MTIIPYFYSKQHTLKITNSVFLSVVNKSYEEMLRTYLHLVWSVTYRNKQKKRTSSRHEASDNVTYIAYNFTGYPTDEQARFFIQNFGNCRFLWNRMVSDYRKYGKAMSPAWYKKQEEFSANRN